MNKKESLAFLQSCIDKTNAATDEEIISLQKAYEKNCTDPIICSNFEFIPPVDLSNDVYGTFEVMQIKISKTDCTTNTSKILWNYNFEGTITKFNEQNNEDFLYAA